MQIRRATMEDMYEMQHCNLRCLPENYNLRYYLYHILSWPQLLYVQEDTNRNVVGYVLAKMDNEEVAATSHGHITSLAVLRSHRRLGVASRVMRWSMDEMEKQFNANFCSLHVRRTNDAALHLYQETLGFRCANVEEQYYVDNEDAFHMRRYFKDAKGGYYITPDKRLVRDHTAATSSAGYNNNNNNNAGNINNNNYSNGNAMAAAGTSAVGANDVGTAASGHRLNKKAAEAVKREQLELAAELLEEDLKKDSGRQKQKGGKGKGGKR